MIFLVIILASLCVAYANGANDNFKGVATLFGSGTTDYRRALWWATATTLLGSFAAFLLAGNLIKSFGGKGLVDDLIASQPAFAAAVGAGAGLTVLIATRIGMPVSTTHSLIGALIGTGWVAGSGMNYSNLGTNFLIPLLLSPILAVVVTGFTANIITGLIVIGASRFGLPVSTTHVSCGSLFGIGAVTGGARGKTIVTILLAWIVTLPLAAALASVSYSILSLI